MKSSLTFKIALASVMAALAIVLEKLSIPLGDGTYKITLYGFPLLFTSVFYGPLVGGCAGLVVGFISQLTSIYGISATSVLWMIAPVLWGTVGGLILKLFKSENKYNIFNIIIVVVITSLLVSLTNSLVMFLDGQILGYVVEQTLVNIVIRCLISLAMCVPYSIVLYFLCNRLKHLSWQKRN